ncbi:MAG: type 4a pilus biogenesis protein PilO [Acidobacteria bacterium]|nr:type 4a pilus biogenesis protein PilO [Acidobacteriota bacterium]MBV9479700.1 type 4a pilus biogenesis protein PilO [Acidobacteriota bacterium]
MGTFSELPGIKQWALVLLGGMIVSAALYFTVFKSQRDANAQAQQQLDTKQRENRELEAYRPKLAEMERQLATLKQQLEIERRIVPDDKQADDFIRAVDAEALKAGIELRRYTAMTVSNKDFYSEMPFELELDGPYYSMLNFFDRVGKLERIVNVSNLLVSSVRKPSDAKTKHQYNYAPGESVVATCIATTFFSHDMTPASTTASAPVKR